MVMDIAINMMVVRKERKMSDFQRRTAAKLGGSKCKSKKIKTKKDRFQSMPIAANAFGEDNKIWDSLILDNLNIRENYKGKLVYKKLDIKTSRLQYDSALDKFFIIVTYDLGGLTEEMITDRYIKKIDTEAEIANLHSEYENQVPLEKI
eukprot:Pgem_evm1s14136